jgi:hypothetical protein
MNQSASLRELVDASHAIVSSYSQRFLLGINRSFRPTAARNRLVDARNPNQQLDC